MPWPLPPTQLEGLPGERFLYCAAYQHPMFFRANPVPELFSKFWPAFLPELQYRYKKAIPARPINHQTTRKDNLTKPLKNR
jgi:hypothetical protein